MDRLPLAATTTSGVADAMPKPDRHFLWSVFSHSLPLPYSFQVQRYVSKQLGKTAGAEFICASRPRNAKQRNIFHPAMAQKSIKILIARRRNVFTKKVSLTHREADRANERSHR